MRVKKYPKIQKSIIKIVGLLEEVPGLESRLISNGYTSELQLEEESAYIKDNFYPDFRNLMFFKHELVNNRRLEKDINQLLTISSGKDSIDIFVKNAEIFLFGKEYIALFSVSIDSDFNNLGIDNISDLLNMIRQLEVNVNNEIKWFQWIESNILGGTKIRGSGTTFDEFYGSKFKLYTIIDIGEGIEECDRENLLYDLGTTSPIGSSSNPHMLFNPHPDYLLSIMKNRISIFNNWGALALFDSFTVIGNGLGNLVCWNRTYFRIYLLRLFFKYNLYRFNSRLSYDGKIIKLRASYENFLNVFDINPISYNFLPNEIHKRIGEGLEIKSELEDFHKRINRMSDTIKEKKQERMNLILGFISVVNTIAIFEVIPKIPLIINETTGIPAVINFTLMIVVPIILVNIIFRFLNSQKKISSIWRKLFGKK